MLTPPTQVEQLEAQKAQAQELIKKRDRVLRLADVKLFKEIILDEFCEAESARYAHASADPALKPEERADALAMAQAGGHLRRWLSMQVQMASVAERQLPDIEEHLEEARFEEEAERQAAAEAASV